MKIISAYYGGYNIKAVDVTTQVQNIVNQAQGASVSIKVLAETFGIKDPDPGVRKSLVINYQYDTPATTLTKSGVDFANITLDLSCNQFEIVSATYSSQSIFLDITEKLQLFVLESIHNTKLMVGYSDFLNRFCDGRDIDPGVAKSFEISFYTSPGGELINVCANDGQPFDFNADF